MSALDANVVGGVAGRASRALVPLSLGIEVTRACNLGCIHCYAQAGWPRTPDGVARARKELSAERWLGILGQAAALGSLYLTVTGGEPLMRPDIIEILAGARRQRFAVRLYTNATLVDEGVADRLAALGLIAVDVSLYGANPEVHDAITRTPGSHARTVRGIGLLVDHGVSVVAKMPVMTVNLGEVRGVLDLADALRIKLRVDPTITPTSGGDTSPTKLRIQAEEYAEVLSELRKRGVAPEPVDAGGDAFPCGAGRITAAVNALGMLMPCIGYPIEVADLTTTSLAVAWMASPVLDEMRRTRRRDLAGCRQCAIPGYCRRCPGVAYLETGDAGERVPYSCMMASVTRAVNSGNKDNGAR